MSFLSFVKLLDMLEILYKLKLRTRVAKQTKINRYQDITSVLYQGKSSFKSLGSVVTKAVQIAGETRSTAALWQHVTTTPYLCPFAPAVSVGAGCSSRLGQRFQQVLGQRRQRRLGRVPHQQRVPLQQHQLHVRAVRAPQGQQENKVSTMSYSGSCSCVILVMEHLSIFVFDISISPRMTFARILQNIG